MEKGILIIDTPEDCINCPLCGEEHTTYRDYCRITAQYIWTLDKPDWCPIRPMPEKECREHGHWILRVENNDCDMTYQYECSKCGQPARYATNYCPNCGIVMDEELEKL